MPATERHPQPADPDLALLQRLVEIPSLSGHEQAAATFLAGWMAERGAHAFVDAAGNAVGIFDGGPAADGSPPQDIVLLGHIDTVGGQVPVRIEDGRLYGRGAVDAKGPLATFAAAAAKVGPLPGWRIVVIGAVEEEAATSKGARYVATQYQPALCVIGEPSGWTRVTLGYKGRLLVHVTVQQPMSHTAGPEVSVCEQAVDYWNRVHRRVAEINAGRERPWDQVLPSLRSFGSDSDGLTETARLMLGFRLPLDVGPEAMQAELEAVAGGGWRMADGGWRMADGGWRMADSGWRMADGREAPRRAKPGVGGWRMAELGLRFEGGEAAFRAEKNNALVRAFLAAIRSQGEQPGFVLKTGTSDMNVVGPAWQCPIVAYGPGDSALDHTPHEHVEIAEWQRGVAVLAGVLQRLAATA